MNSSVARTPVGSPAMKAGELGYSGYSSSNTQQSLTMDMRINARHPADSEPDAFHPVSLQDMQAELPLRAPSKPKSDAHELCGIRVFTIVVLALLLLLLAGTGVAWFFTIRRLNISPRSPDSSKPTSAPNTIIILTHVAFALGTLIQLIFIERGIFHLRAERYAYTHRHQQQRLGTRNTDATLSMSFAPWNRPPLPTYAFALAQSGSSTGDVEDSRIAIAPPPAYGQTHKTKMLQQGYLRESLRRVRPVSFGSMDIQMDRRPASYQSDQDNIKVDADAVEIRDDAMVVRESKRILRTSMESKEPFAVAVLRVQR